MILVAYFFIFIVYGSSNTASQNSYFKGELPLTDVQTHEVQLSEKPYHQRRFSSYLKYNTEPTNLFPGIDRGNIFIYNKALRSLSNKDYLPKTLETNKISPHIKRRSKNNRRKTKANSRIDLDGDDESIKNLFNKSRTPLEYLKKTFQISVDSKEDSPEVFGTKNQEKWWESNLSPNESSYEKPSQNFPERPSKSKNRFVPKPKKRSLGIQSQKSTLPLDNQYSQSNTKCQPLESLHLFQNVKFGKLDSDEFKKCLLLHKTNKVELLIENKGDTSKFLDDAFHGDLFSVFKIMDRLPSTLSYESKVSDDYINFSDNIQTPFKRIENSDFLNAETKDSFLPIDADKFQMFSNAAKELEYSNKDKETGNMYPFPNIDYGGPETEQRINGDFRVHQMPLKNSFFENFPSVQGVHSSKIRENQNYVQIENKETSSKIIFPINDTASKEMLDTSIKNFKPIPVVQPGNPSVMDLPKHIETSEGPTFENIFNNLPTLSFAGYVGTEFPYTQTKEKQVPKEMNNNSYIPTKDIPNAQTKEQFLKEISKYLYTPYQTTSANREPLKIENKVKPNEDRFFNETQYNKLPTQIPISYLKTEPLESETKAPETKLPINQTIALVSSTFDNKDIHIVITEPVVTQTIFEAITEHKLKESTEIDYNAKYPPVNLHTEETPETDVNMLKMHYRHPQGTKVPEIRHRRQFFNYQS